MIVTILIYLGFIQNKITHHTKLVIADYTQ
jgi:hypothetical protein